MACNGCVDVCPENLIRLVGLSTLRNHPQWTQWVADGLGVTTDELVAMDRSDLDQRGGVMLKDETTCIRCAMCASRCPTHAIRMKRFDHYRECVSVPVRNPKVNYATNGYAVAAAEAKGSLS